MAEQKKMFLEIIADRDSTIIRLQSELENMDNQMNSLNVKVSCILLDYHNILY